jgi:S-(hydroxymethyl)glutathione dehydrogenase/alcohol dehydrogenase
MLEFKAAVLHSAGAALQIERIRLTGVGPNEVLVKIHAAGVCHTDWEAQQGRHLAPRPLILGHEGAGVVVEVGKSVSRKRVGEHVVLSAYPSCGGCFYCERHLPMLCEPVTQGHRKSRLPDGSSRLRLGDEEIGHFLSISSFAEYVVVPSKGAVQISANMPLDLACLLGCAVITGAGAALRIAEVQANDTVCIIGCGAVGLNVVQGARMAGAGVIVASDTDQTRLKMALELGATHVVKADEEDVVSVMRHESGGRGADHSFETAGHEATLQAAFEASRVGGNVIILSKMDAHRMVNLRFGSLSGERRIRRSALGGARGGEDLPMLAHAYLDGRLKLEEMVTSRRPLSHVNEALDAAGSGSVIRTVLTM